MCPECRRPVKECACRQIKRSAVPETSGKVIIRRETAGRKGKGATVIRGLPLSLDQLEQLARRLKSTFGTGGTVKDGAIELQGDLREKAAAELRRQGLL